MGLVALRVVHGAVSEQPQASLIETSESSS